MPDYSIPESSNIYLMKNVQFDAQYDHTVIYPSAQIQNADLMSKVAFTFTANYYTRHTRGKLRIQTPYTESLFECNYLAFQNANVNFENKWIYAFITDSEYINNNTAEITYEIDVMQTFMFDYELGECFVEREHTLTDYVGDNTTDEGLETGDLIRNTSIAFTYPYTGAYGSIANYLRISYVPNEKRLGVWYFDGTGGVASLPVVNYDPPLDPSLVGGVMSCGQIGMYCFLIIPINNSDNGLTRANLMVALKKLQSISAQIVSVDGMPAEMFADFYSTTSESLTQTPPEHTNSMTEIATFRDRSGVESRRYTPKNKKLYCFPYRQITVINSSGKSNTLKWELFSSRSSANLPVAEFKKQNFVIPNCSAYLAPQNYRGIPNDYSSGLSLDNFPAFPWSEDSYTKWVAQNSESNSTKVVSAAISTAISFGLSAAVAAIAPPAAGTSMAVLGLAGGAVNKGISTAAGITAQRQSAQCTPDSACGAAERNDIPLVNEWLGFHIYDMCITAEFAQRIDSFFSMYGYKVNELKVPNIQATPITGLRPQWNYVKLGSCVIHPKSGSGLMQKYENKIADIYLKGITFWRTMANIGNYSLPNDPPV